MSGRGFSLFRVDATTVARAPRAVARPRPEANPAWMGLRCPSPESPARTYGVRRRRSRSRQGSADTSCGGRSHEGLSKRRPPPVEARESAGSRLGTSRPDRSGARGAGSVPSSPIRGIPTQPERQAGPSGEGHGSESGERLLPSSRLGGLVDNTSSNHLRFYLFRATSAAGSEKFFAEIFRAASPRALDDLGFRPDAPDLTRRFDVADSSA